MPLPELTGLVLIKLDLRAVLNHGQALGKPVIVLPVALEPLGVRMGPDESKPRALRLAPAENARCLIAASRRRLYRGPVPDLPLIQYVEPHPASPLESTSARSPARGCLPVCRESASPIARTAPSASGASCPSCSRGRWCTGRTSACRACRSPAAAFVSRRFAGRTPVPARRC